jgi:hypothetical protein
MQENLTLFLGGVLLIRLTWENFVSGEHCITHVMSVAYYVEHQFFVRLECDFLRIGRSDQGSARGSTCSNV